MITGRRFNADLIHSEIAKILSVRTGRRAVLVDQDIGPISLDLELIDVRSQTPDALYGEPLDCALYAVDQDDRGLPFVRWLIEHNVKFFPAWSADPAHWVHKDAVSREAIELEHEFQTKEQFDKFDFGYGDAENICQALNNTRRMEGSFVEVGCFRGSSGSVALRYMQRSGIYRPCFFFDVFDGFNYDAAKKSTDAFWVNSHGTEGLDIVSKRLKRFDQPLLGRPITVAKNNIITEELPDGVGSIAVANLDVDQLEAIYAGLTKLAPKMALGGILIVEDPGHTPLLIGATVAMDLFLKTDIAQDFTPIYMRSGQYFLVRVKTR